jgi:hypothetical protein
LSTVTAEEREAVDGTSGNLAELLAFFMLLQWLAPIFRLSSALISDACMYRIGFTKKLESVGSGLWRAKRREFRRPSNSPQKVSFPVLADRTLGNLKSHDVRNSFAKMSEMLPTALSCPLERAPESQNKSPEGHTTPRMLICDPRAQPAITITKARPHSHDIHAATQELTDISAHLQHSQHTRASHEGTNATMPPATPSVPARPVLRDHVCAHQ